jgi:hypothetical protein
MNKEFSSNIDDFSIQDPSRNLVDENLATLRKNRFEVFLDGKTVVVDELLDDIDDHTSSFSFHLLREFDQDFEKLLILADLGSDSGDSEILGF